MELRDERVATGRIVVQTIYENPQRRIRCRLGEEEPKVTSGYGGWSTVDRPYKRKLTDWGVDGTEPVRVELTLTFGDFFGVHGSVEEEIHDLETMAGLNVSGVEPPLVIWEANAPHDYREKKTTEWFIDTLEWDTVKRNTNGNIFFAKARLVFCSFTEDQYSKLTPSARSRNKKKKPLAGRDRTPGGRYTVKAGDTLSKIAQKRLGNHKRWREIAKLNHIRDPHSIHVGQKLRMPS